MNEYGPTIHVTLTNIILITQAAWFYTVCAALELCEYRLHAVRCDLWRVPKSALDTTLLLLKAGVYGTELVLRSRMPLHVYIGFGARTCGSTRDDGDDRCDDFRHTRV